MNRRLALLVVPLLLFPVAAFAQTMPVAPWLAESAGLTLMPLSGSLLGYQSYEDPADDIYHPAGTPGYTDGNIDIRKVDLSVWAIADGGAEYVDPFDPALTADDDVRRGQPDWEFNVAGPYVIAEFELALDINYTDDLYCEYPLAWSRPDYDVFQGIEGDLFNGTNYVTVARTGRFIDGGFQARGIDFMDGTWQEMASHGGVAASGNRVAFAIPAAEFGSAGDGLRASLVDFLQSDEPVDTVVDFNFGAFCSEGGQSFDPGLGGVDILQTPVDLLDLPVHIVEPVPISAPTTTVTTAAVTTTDAAPTTTLPQAAEEGGGVNPALIALLVGGAAGAAYVAVRSLRRRAEDAKPGTGFRVRLELDGGPSSGFSSMSGLELDPTAVEYRDGAEPALSRRGPGVTKYATITLRGGDADAKPFYEWAKTAAESSEPSSGAVVLESTIGTDLEWRFDRGWVTPGPKLAESAIESMEMRLENVELRIKR